MFYHLGVDRRRDRIYCRASGIWDVDLANRFRKDMYDIQKWAKGARLQILTDLTGLPVHAKDVWPIISEGAGVITGLNPARYAMIVPMTLMRMQTRRLEPIGHRRFFDDVSAAAEWLGWSDFVPVENI